MDFKVKMPDIANGTKVPYGMLEKQLEESKQEYLRKKQFRHDWLIACFSCVTGAIFGFLASFVFWLITG